MSYRWARWAWLSWGFPSRVSPMAFTEILSSWSCLWAKTCRRVSTRKKYVLIVEVCRSDMAKYPRSLPEAMKIYEICPAQLPTMEGLQATEPEFSQMDRISLAWHMASRPWQCPLVNCDHPHGWHVKDWFKMFKKRILSATGTTTKNTTSSFLCRFLLTRLFAFIALFSPYFLFLLFVCSCLLHCFLPFFPCSKECEN